MSDVILEHRGRRIRPKTVNQKAYVDAIRSNTITFGIGPAGTGKTYLAMAMATAALLSGDVARIILTRPAVEAGEKLGFLPGGLMEKVDPYLRPLFDALYDMMDSERLTEHLERGTIEVAPLAYMRGRTLNDSLIILDEAQNTTPEQMKMFLTRLGFGAKMIVTGDITQIDLPRGPAFGPGERGATCSPRSPTSRSSISTARTWCGTSWCRTSSRPTKLYGEQHRHARHGAVRTGSGGAPPRRPGRGRGRRVSAAGHSHEQAVIPPAGAAGRLPGMDRRAEPLALRTRPARLPAGGPHRHHLDGVPAGAARLHRGQTGAAHHRGGPDRHRARRRGHRRSSSSRWPNWSSRSTSPTRRRCPKATAELEAFFAKVDRLAGDGSRGPATRRRPSTS